MRPLLFLATLKDDWLGRLSPELLLSGRATATYFLVPHGRGAHPQSPMNSTLEPVTLTKAVVRAAEQLGLSQELPDILGLTVEDASRLVNAERALDRNGDEWQRAIRFVGLFRSLLSLLGNIERARAWLGSPNQTLGSAPAELLRSAAGRDRVYSYVDAVQKHEFRMPPRWRQHKP
jgi:uncharacterized protein (DUF2384 family)